MEHDCPSYAMSHPKKKTKTCRSTTIFATLPEATLNIFNKGSAEKYHVAPVCKKVQMSGEKMSPNTQS
jgi:hypothetical protein